MSTTLTTLEINAEIMRELYPDVFTTANYTATRLKELKKSLAKDKLKADCIRVYNLDPSDTADMSDLDTVINNYSEAFQRALMYLQCYYYFREVDDIEGLNATRKKDCLTNYESELSNFPNYSTSSLMTTAIGTCLRG